MILLQYYDCWFFIFTGFADIQDSDNIYDVLDRREQKSRANRKTAVYAAYIKKWLPTTNVPMGFPKRGYIGIKKILDEKQVHYGQKAKQSYKPHATNLMITSINMKILSNQWHDWLLLSLSKVKNAQSIGVYMC